MDFVAAIFHELMHSVLRHVRFIIKLEENVRSLTNALDELINARDDVEREVELGEMKGLIRTHEVRRWLERVQATDGEVKEIVAAFNQRRTFLEDCCPNFWSSYELGRRVAKKLEDVVELKHKRDFNHVAVESISNRGAVIPSTSTVGMDLTMKKVRSCLEDDEVGIIGIFGIGGVGKTALLRRINNLLQGSHHFDMVIWVVVGTKPNVRLIQKNIAMWLGLSLPEDQDQGAEVIFHVLRWKKFLLFLDDVWQRLDLEKVGIPHPTTQNNCKVIFTTRSLAVCRSMEAHREIKVEPLEWREAWELFQKNVGDAMNSYPEITMLAKTIAQLCGGLPLALIIVGRAMVHSRTRIEWEHAITELHKSPFLLRGMTDEVLLRLKFSYDNLLDDDTLKNCFLYCALFPVDFVIEKGELIDYWIGEGFFDSYEFSDLDGARYKGHDLIGKLKGACFLEDGPDEETQVRMHVVIRYLALWITSEYGEKNSKLLVLADTGLTEASILKQGEEVTRISLIRNKLEALNETLFCPNLLTFMLQQNMKLNKISSSIFQHMRLLRVLDLSDTQLEELPIGIGDLGQLRYLNLSGTDIVTLPGELVHLVELKHLDLSSTRKLETIPSKMLATFSKLQVLNLYNSKYRYWKVEGSDDDQSGVDFSELEGMKELNDLRITINNVDALNRFLGSPILTKCTQNLAIGDCNGLTCFRLPSFENMNRLKNLSVSRCPELESITCAAVEEEIRLLSSLESLSLWKVIKLKTILVPRGYLQNLRFVYFSECHILKNVSWVLHLQSLQEIRLDHCDGIEEVVIVIGDEFDAIEQDLMAFPRLKLLYLNTLPRLKSICRQALAFPSLESLVVRDCPKLKRLPFNPDSANNNLQKIYGKEEWWDGLEEDERIKSAFLPYFKAY